MRTLIGLVAFSAFSAAVAQPGISDCGLAGFICGDTVVIGSSMSQGTVVDLGPSNKGCLGFVENAGNRSAWFMFTAASAGDIGCLIYGSVGQINLDMAVWGPFANPVCPPPTPPIRCSWVYNPGGGNGLFPGSVDTVEYAAGDGGLRVLNVEPGQTYVMVVMQSGTFDNDVSVVFNLMNGATLSCPPPTVVAGLNEGAGSTGPRMTYQNALLSISEVDQAQVLVTDALGRIVHGAGIIQSTTIPTSGWSTGHYLVVVSEKGRRTTRSIAVVD